MLKLLALIIASCLSALSAEFAGIWKGTYTASKSDGSVSEPQTVVVKITGTEADMCGSLSASGGRERYKLRGCQVTGQTLSFYLEADEHWLDGTATLRDGNTLRLDIWSTPLNCEDPVIHSTGTLLRKPVTSPKTRS